MRSRAAVADAISQELLLIRQQVPGVRGSIIATGDGIMLAHDLPGLEPSQIAALAAATYAVAARASLSTECGQLREVITHGSDGYLAVYAAGAVAVVAVLGASDMNVAMLKLQSRTMVDRIAEHAAVLARGRRPGTAAANTAANAADAATAAAGRGAQPLPGRRPPS